MQNTIQPYAWGSRTALAGLLGQKQPSEGPQAELWMGAHPRTPSKVYFNEQWQDLDRVIRWVVRLDRLYPNVSDFSPRPLEILTAELTGVGEYQYPSQVGVFVLARLQVTIGQPYLNRPWQRPSAHILLCTQGEAVLQWNNDGSSELVLPQGRSALRPASLPDYAVMGNATLFRASVNPDV